MIRRPPKPPLFPSPPLFRSPRRGHAAQQRPRVDPARVLGLLGDVGGVLEAGHREERERGPCKRQERRVALVELERQDRKSTRLNSSHANISYAVFCLKKNIF